MSGSRFFACSVLLALALLLSPAVFAQDAKTLAQQAGAAYEAKDFAKAAKLFVAAAEVAGPGKANDYYNAACSYALAGQADEAFRALQASIDAGLSGDSPAGDADFTSLHADPRWAPLLARYEAAHPELAALKAMRDNSKSEIRHYLDGRAAIAAGASITDRNSLFNQVYAAKAQFVGEYDEATRVYFKGEQVDDVVAAGYIRAVDALPVVLAQARGRQAVFVNESHGRSETRAANYALLAGLRAEGFDVLAMETLSATKPVARDATHCSNTSLGDPELPARGYAVSKSGYYSQDPVYAETIREALRLGFRLVAYDSNVGGGVPEREQNQAENLACIFKQDPKARLVVIAGFSHIGERKDFWVPGGAMAYRFRQLSGIDPLTVDSTTQLYLDPSKLSFSATTPVSYVLEDAEGSIYRTDNFDLVLYVPGGAHRDDGKPSWLSLGGTRQPTHVDVPACRDVTPCIIQARRVGEQADAVPADACVPSAPATGCNLFLRPGSYEVIAEGAEAVIARVPVTAGGK
jgi:hypothetical protein